MDLERARIELQIKKCEMAQAEFQFKIYERMQDIERLESLIREQEVQKKKYLEELTNHG